MSDNPEIPQEQPNIEEPQSVPPQKRPWYMKWKQFSIGTLALAILIHVVFGVVAGYVIVARYSARQKQFAGTPKTPGPPKEVLHSVQMAKKKNTMSAPAMPKRVTVNSAMSKVALPAMPSMPVSDVSAPTKIAGMGGTGMGTGLGTGGGFGGMGGGGGGVFSLPKIMADRCTPVARLRAMKETGGKESSEAAVVKALKFLEGKQNPDGSWGNDKKGAMTGLALLSFLGHCEIQSPALKKGIDYLVAEANKNGGHLAGSDTGQQNDPYQHGIATYALAEAYSMTKRKDIEPALRNAAAIIVGGQRSGGGWAYAYNTSGGADDLSVAGWQMQALKAAHYTGLNIDGVDKAMDKAIRWVPTMQDKASGHFGYNNAADAHGEHRLTGVGVLALQVWNHAGSFPAQHGVRTIGEHAKNFNYKGPDANLYAWYYETQCMINAGGDHWKKWNAVFQDQIVSNQESSGSWPATGAKAPHAAGSLADGDVYRTALCTLMLEVYYRYLPSSKSVGSGASSVKF